VPAYLTIEQVHEAGRWAFIFVSSDHDDDPAAVIWRDGRYYYREHLFGDPREHLDEHDIELSTRQVFEGSWGVTARYMRTEWRHEIHCDCRFCRGHY